MKKAKPCQLIFHASGSHPRLQTGRLPHRSVAPLPSPSTACHRGGARDERYGRPPVDPSASPGVWGTKARAKGRPGEGARRGRERGRQTGARCASTSLPGGAPGAGAPPRLRSPSPGAARQQASEHGAPRAAAGRGLPQAAKARLGAPRRGPRRWLGPRCSEARREGASLGGAARRARAARQRSPGVLTPGLCPVSGLSGLQTHPPAFRWRVFSDHMVPPCIRGISLPYTFTKPFFPNSELTSCKCNTQF